MPLYDPPLESAFVALPEVETVPAFPWPEETAKQHRSQIFTEKDAWRWAEQDYGDGKSALEICRFYNLALSTFRTRARREGWRRLDMAERTKGVGTGGDETGGDALADGPTPLAEHEPPPAPSTENMADLAWRSIADAIGRGKVHEARAWMKLVKELREEIEREGRIARNAARLAEETAAKALATEAAECKDTDTNDTELHPLHSKTEGATDDDDPLDLAGLSREIAELEAQVASGRAGPNQRELLNALKAEERAVKSAQREIAILEAAQTRREAAPRIRTL